ncbi:MAG: protein kinase [Planctomycetota bacterium]
MTIRVRIEHGQDAGRTWRFSHPGVYVIGRHPKTSMRVLDMKVSHEHARLRILGEGASARATLRDVGSRHGTLLNGQPLQKEPKPLKPGDEIRLGLSILRVLSDGKADVEPEPVAEGATAEAASPEDDAAGTCPKKRRKFAPDALVGKEIGGYRVLEKIGQGGMGSVYTAEQISLNREVALKVLSEKFTSDRAFVDQFVNEARSAAALNHPNVVQVYDVGREDGRYYFSMEYVSGGSLEERLAEDGPVDWRQGLNWMIDAANALIFAQKREILHRDVKPDNLMLAENGSAKLCDLGLAKKAANEDMLAAGIIGTPAFISPEAIRRRKDIDVRSDLYSLGCTFYRLLTGKNPYPGKTVKDILIGHLRSPVPRVSAKVKDLPPDLDDAIFKLMAKEPADRFQTPQELLHALDRIRIQHGLEAHGIRPASRRPLVFALVALLIGLAAVLYAVTRPKEEGRTGLTPEQLTAQRKKDRELEEGRFSAFVKDARIQKQDLDLEAAQPPLGIDNWARPRWPRLADAYDTLAKRIEKDAKYGKRQAVVALAEQARRAGRDIREDVALRRRLDKSIQEARKKAAAAFETQLARRRKAIDAKIGAGAWLEAAKLLDPKSLDALIAPARDRKVQDILPAEVPPDARERFKDDLLLDPEKDVQPQVARYLPGDPVGQMLREHLLEAIPKQKAAALAPTRVKEPTHETVARGLASLEAYLDAVPEPDPTDEGEVAQALAQARGEAEAARETLEETRIGLQQADYLHDRFAYFGLLKTLRAPGGLFFRLDLESARVHAEEAAAVMRTPGYAVLARQLALDAQALEGLLAHVATAYPDGWSSRKVPVIDARGRVQSVRVRAASPRGLKLGSEERPYAALGPAWILHTLLLPPGGEPLIEFADDDHRALAVLGELAIDYDLVERALQAYLGRLPPDRTEDQEATRRRLANLRRERAAAEAWKLAIENARQVQETLDAYDPKLIGEEAFWDGGKARELLAQESELRRLLTEARGAQMQLADATLATTVWASVLRSEPDPLARYAGEPPPPPEKKAPPKKEPPKKAGPADDEDAADGR